MPEAEPELSVIVPRYDEEEVLPIFFERMRPSLDWPELRLVRLLRNYDSLEDAGHQPVEREPVRT